MKKMTIHKVFPYVPLDKCGYKHYINTYSILVVCFKDTLSSFFSFILLNTLGMLRVDTLSIGLRTKVLCLQNKRILDKKDLKDITMNYYSDDDVITKFYLSLFDESSDWVHIPRSDVFYVRAAIEADTGVRYTLDHVERAMFLEGYLKAHDVFEPDRPREGID